MVKTLELVKEDDLRSAEALKALLSHVPAIEIVDFEREVFLGPDIQADFVMNVRHGGEPYALLAEVKRSGQPLHVRSAIWQLLSYVRRNGDRHVPVLISPYFSPQSQAICEEAGVSYLDLCGNACLAFGSVYVERSVADKPKAETRALRSVFSPKAAQILSFMYLEPDREWRVTELAKTAHVSLGHVSNVRKALLEREWIAERRKGVALSDPDGLLDVWRENYRRPLGDSISGYTYLHGSSLTDRLRHVLSPEGDNGRVIGACQTAAQWIAPFERETTHHFYADPIGAGRLQDALDFTPAVKGPNVVIRVPRDESVFQVVAEPTKGIFCTSALRTYLDLWSVGERSREAADFLREKYLRWHQ